MQHVLFSINNYPPTLGGVEMHVFRLAEELISLDHQVTVVTVSDQPGAALKEGYERFGFEDSSR